MGSDNKLDTFATPVIRKRNALHCSAVRYYVRPEGQVLCYGLILGLLY